MVISFPRFSCWLRGGKKEQSVSKRSTVNSSSGPKKRESKKLRKVKETKIVPSPSSRKVHGRRKIREGDRIDREFDFVVVPSDCGERFSGSESDSDDDSEYTVGWVEPHGPSFQSVGEPDGGFAVLLPLYGGKKVESSNNEILSAFKKLPDEFSSGGEKYLAQWRDDLKNFY